jgi:hypothetical protein
MDVEYSETTGNIIVAASPEEATVFVLAFAHCAVAVQYVPTEALEVMRDFTRKMITNVVPHLSPAAQEFLSDTGVFFTEEARKDVTDIEPDDIKPFDEPQ